MIFSLPDTSWRGERAQYLEDIHEKNGFSQVSKNFQIYPNNIPRKIFEYLSKIILFV